MKVAGGLLCGIGGFLVIMNILFQNSTGKNADPVAILLGLVLVVVGIILCVRKNKNNGDSKKD